VSLAHPVVFSTINGDGSADFTISIDDEDHKFSAAPGEGRGAAGAILSYEETQSWRGEIRVKEPREEVWSRLMKSDKMTEYLDSENLNGVRRQRHD